MLATLASLVIAGAGVAALVAVSTTWRGQLGAIRQLLADAHALEQAEALELDRAFLARLVDGSVADQGFFDRGQAESAPALRTTVRNVRRVAPRQLVIGSVVTGLRRAAA